MPSLTFIEHDGTVHVVEAQVGRTVMQAATDAGVPGLLGDCGGACSCATCHGHVDARWRDALPPVSESEAFMLEGLDTRDEDSRLCCQLRVSTALDGLVIRLPSEQL